MTDIVKRLDLGWIYVSLVILFLLAPLLAILVLSLSKTVYLEFPPALFSVRWYKELAGNQKLIQSLLYSLRVAIPATIISTICGTLAALGNRVLKKRFASFNRILFVAPLIVPYVVLATGVGQFFTFLGLRGLTAITLTHSAIALPYVFLLVNAGIQLLPQGVEEAAGNLGAPPLAVIWKVTLPLLKPHIFTGMVFAFIASFGEFIIAYMLSGPRSTLLTVYIYSSIREKTEPSISALLSLITLAVIMISALYSVYYLKKRRTA